MKVAHLIDGFTATLRAEVQAGLVEPATEQWYYWQLKKLRAVAGELQAAELRVRHLATLKLTHHLVRACKRLYRWAIDEELVERDPFRKMKTPRCGERKRVLTPAEVLRLYRAINPKYRVMLFVQLHTASRPGEMRLLRWDEVHLEARIIRLKEFKAKNRREDGAQVRPIPLSHAVCRRLAALKLVSTSPFVFPAPNGNAYTSNAVQLAMRAARRRAGLQDGGERVTCYTLRHTEATAHKRAGMDLLTLSRVLGHTNLDMTKRYVHQDEADLVAAVDAAAG